MKVADVHARSLATSAELTRYYMPETILPLEVVKVLQKAKIPFILAGAHGIFGWMGVNEARPTKVVDVIVAERYHQKAVKLLLESYPHLEPVKLEVVTRLKRRNSEDFLVDVMRTRALCREAFKHTHQVHSGKLVYRVPSLEMALAMKFGAMISPTRDDAKKLMDAHDFIMIVRAHENIDMELVVHLGELVYSGGGAEIVELVRRVRAGETLIL